VPTGLAATGAPAVAALRSCERFERVCHIGVREPIVSVPSFLPHDKQAAPRELREMQARRRRGEPRLAREHVRWQRAPIEQSEENRCARRLAEERRNVGE
jgi:hypothetical protein